jgi:hypothetical protein
MTTSGTYNFGPELGSLFLNAFSRIQVKPPSIVAQHMFDARLEANLLQAEWVNSGLELWLEDTQTINLISGTATYNVPANTIMILDLYVTPTGGSNRLLLPFSRTDYASLATPLQQGFPTSFFFLRTVNPTITFWPTPDSANTYVVTYWRYRQIQDAVPGQGGNADLQYRFLDAYTAGLAHRLSRHYAPALEQQRKADYDIAFGLAMKQDTENVGLYITPGLASFFR